MSFEVIKHLKHTWVTDKITDKAIRIPVKNIEMVLLT